MSDIDGAILTRYRLPKGLRVNKFPYGWVFVAGATEDRMKCLIVERDVGQNISPYFTK